MPWGRDKVTKEDGMSDKVNPEGTSQRRGDWPENTYGRDGRDGRDTYGRRGGGGVSRETELLYGLALRAGLVDRDEYDEATGAKTEEQRAADEAVAKAKADAERQVEDEVAAREADTQRRIDAAVAEAQAQAKAAK